MNKYIYIHTHTLTRSTKRIIKRITKRIVGVIGPGMHIYIYIGPRAQSEDIK